MLTLASYLINSVSFCTKIRLILIAACFGLLIVNSGCANTGQESDSSQNTKLDDIGKMDTTLGSYGSERESNLILVTMDPSVHTSLLQGIPGSANELDESKLPMQFRQFLLTLKQQHGIVRVADWPLDSIGIRCLVFESDGSKPLNSIIRTLNQTQLIDTAQKVNVFSTHRSAYNDPYFPLQHGFNAIRAEISHQWATGNGVKVAVIDTGVDDEHIDLKNSIHKTANFVDENINQFRADKHGTAVVGIISATPNNAAGMVGVAPDVKIYALKACWNEQKKSGAICNSYTLAKALNIAIRNKVDIINLSLSGPADSLLARLINRAEEQNIIVVGAQDPAGVDKFPATLKAVIAAAMHDDTSSQSVSAPGSKVVSTAPDDDYGFYTGSSFSAAHVTGLAALLRELDPKLDHVALQKLLHIAKDGQTGSIDTCMAIAELSDAGEVNCTRQLDSANSLN